VTDLIVLLRNKTTVVWLGLTAATLLSYALGADHGIGSSSGHTVASTIILIVALTKVRFVGQWFMELREAPAVLRWLFDGYVVALFGLLWAMYLAA
jgi:hypothetical protein